MNQTIKILHLEDTPSDAALVARELKKGEIDCEIILVNNKVKFENALKDFSADIILSDHSLPSINSNEALRLVKEAGIRVPFILVTATMSEEFAVSIMKEGADDYIIKDRMQRLPEAVINALERWHLEKKIQENEKRFRAMIEKSADMVTLALPGGKLLYVSPSLTTILGFTKEEYLSRPAIEFIHPDDVEGMMDQMMILMTSPGKSFYSQHRLLHKDGTYRWCEGTVTNMLHDNDVGALVSNFRDITDRKDAEEALIKSNEQFKLLADNMSDWVALHNPNGEYIYVSSSCEKILGYKPEELVGMSPYAIMHPEDIKKVVKEIYKKCLLGEANQISEYRIKNKSGNYVWLETTATILFDETKKTIRTIQSSSRDISERKIAEHKLLQSLKEVEDYKFALNQASIVSITDQKGIIKYVNDNFYNISKFNREELIGQDHRIISSGYHNKEFIKNIWVTIANGNVWRGEIKNKAKDGTYYWVDTAIIPFIDDNKKPFQYVAIRADITKRKIAEETLTQSEARLKEAQAIAHTGNWDINLLQNAHVWSDELYSIFGINKDKVNGSTDLFLSFIHPDDAELVKKNIDESFASLKDSSHSFRFIRNDGSTRYGYIKRKFEFDKNQKATRLYGIVQDITDRKLAEQEREKMVEDIIQRGKNLEQFTYIVSHNLRSPVAVIMSLVNLLRDSTSEVERNQCLQFLFKATEQLDIVIKDLNNILDIKSEITEFKEPVYLSEMVESIESSINSLIQKEKIRISIDFSAIDKIVSIKSYIHSIFFNLISNSIKYRQPDEALVIQIRGYQYEGKIRISFIDNGMGIDLKKNGDKIFGLYKRFHLNIDGKGLGLFMVKTQVEALGGNIIVKSEPHRGAEFIIDLPLLIV